MRVTQWIGIGLPMAAFGFGAIIFASGAARDDRRAASMASEGANAPGLAIGASETPALPAASAASAATERIERGAAPESSLDRELAAPERREAASYPWEDFESILERDLTVKERDALRDLRKEHGLRLAEQHAKMERGELARAEFDAWRAARAAEFRADIARLLGCSADQVTALLRVPMRTASVP
jgi:hypothetical protein